MSNDNYDLSKVFDSTCLSTQKLLPANLSNDLKIQLQSNPPLGQVTSTINGSVTITSVLEVPKTLSEEAWTVCLWHSVNGDDWAGLILPRIENWQAPQSLRPEQSRDTSLVFFSGNISLKNFARFTFKFRLHENEEWTWIHDEQGLSDGHIAAQQSSRTGESLSNLIPDLNEEWNVRSHLSQTPLSVLWSLEATISPEQGDLSTSKKANIGKPWGSFLRWFSLVRLWSPWLAPRQGKERFTLDKDAIMCSFLSPYGDSMVFLAVSGINNVVSMFQHSEAGGISVHARNDSLSDESIVILVAVSNEFERALAAVMYHARNLVAQKRAAIVEGYKETTVKRIIDPVGKNTWYNGLGFCTWNAIGQQLTEEKIFDAMNRLKEHNVNITNLIIDDNWQSIEFGGHSQFEHGWKDFEAEPKAFPQGLKATVSQLREKHPNIQHIAVWHALLGYWGGLSPNGHIAEAYKTVQVNREEAERRNLPLGGCITVVAKEDVARFYDDFYSFLSESGVDAVKTDAQFMVDSLSSASARRELIETYLDAWATSSLHHFGVKSISCMSQFPCSLFHSLLPNNRPELVVRNSDDFFPNIEASHPWHIWANAYNSIFMQFLNVLPDWDMFQTVHEYSDFHAAARCVSGGPIYLSDVPGKHNMDLIAQISGLTPKGMTTVFRPSVTGKSIYPYMGYDDGLLLKVGSYHGASETGTSIIGVFNISGRRLAELIPLSTFPGTIMRRNYVVRAHTTGRVSLPTNTSSPQSLMSLSLDKKGYEILSAFPTTAVVGSNHGQLNVSNLGLVDKMTGCAAILGSNVSRLENGRIAINVKLKALGILGVYISCLPNMTVEDDFMVTIQGGAVPVETVRISQKDTHVLEVDVQSAWVEMELKALWKDEVEIGVHFNG